MAANYVRGWGRAEQVWGEREGRGVVGEGTGSGEGRGTCRG